MAGGKEDLQPVGLDPQQRAPPPPRRPESAQLSACELGANVTGHQRIPTIAGGTAKRVRRRNVPDREDTTMTGHPKIWRHANEPVLIKQFGRQPVGVGSHPTYRPEHGVSGSGGLSDAPSDRFAG